MLGLGGDSSSSVGSSAWDNGKAPDPLPANADMLDHLTASVLASVVSFDRERRKFGR
jgi:hypothetical protein